MPAMCFELLRQRRLRRLTQRQLATKAQVSVRTVARLERGIARPSATVLQRLAAAMDERPEALFPELLGCDPVATETAATS